MSPDGSYRLEDILALLPEDDLRGLAESLECRDTIAAVRDELLAGDRVHRTVSGLDGEAFTALHQVSSVIPPVVTGEEPLAEPLGHLLETGLVFPIVLQEERRLYVPLEVQLELHRQEPLADPDCRILLLSVDEETLAQLESIYLDETEESETPADRLERACRLADAMESLSTLREIHQNLPATAQEILGWTCEHGGPLGSDEVRELARDAAAYYKQRSGVAIEQLVRFGLLLRQDLDESGEVLVVPRSLRRAILSLIDQNLTTQARSAYETLVASGNLSFPDEGPHGWGGDAIRSFRQLTINWVAGRLDAFPNEYGVAVGMQIVDPNQHRPGPFAALLLDLSGETAFSRQALRLWLALVDDPWTMDLVNATQGDAKTLVEHFAGTPPQSTDDDAEVWFGHLFLIRAQLALTLSLLPPGKWFPILGLAKLFHMLLARSTITNLSHETLSAEFPYEALPDYGVLLARPGRLERVKAWLESWLIEFAGVIGGAEVDRSATFFRVHPDAFCVFRDSDLWFRSAWEDLTPIVGDDLDIWMPIPNDPGPRIEGVAALRATGATRLSIERNAHLFDLLRLAQWSAPSGEPSGFGFELTEASVTAALERGLDGEEMLVWLAVRLDDPVPTALRGLFPQSSSAIDAADEKWRTLASERVEELLLSLENWGVSPPGRLLEEIRTWGSAAVSLLESRLAALLDGNRLDEPMTQHVCVLLGELGAVSAYPALIKVITTASSELPQHAAAAALMRIGEPCLKALLGLLRASELTRDHRLIVAMALTGLATLHPHTHDTVADALVQTVRTNAFDRDLQTRLTLELCRTGHPRAETLVEELQSEDGWVSDEWRPEDALWLVRVSPCVWGSLLYSTPMSMLYLVSDEAEELAREAGVRELLTSVGLSSERVLYGRPRPKP